METAQICPPEIRESIARAATALEARFGLTQGALTQASEAAELVGALTNDIVLANGVVIAAVPGRDARMPEDLAALISADSWRMGEDLAALGDVGLPPNWTPEHTLEGRQAEALRKMLLSVVTDPRLVLARIAMQLVRLRHARGVRSQERERLATEARLVFAPLANRLGVWQLKWELEDFAFRYLEREEYRRIASAVSEKRVDRERFIEAFCSALREELAHGGVEGAEVYGRPKHIYSIYRKMQRKQVSIDQIYDVRAVRIVVNSIPDCYAALGIVHGRWPYIPGEFDDYIATPKGNFYRSIHTAVHGPDGRSVEVQIRTREMHEHAELGVAAHWHYKEGGARARQEERRIELARKLLDPAQTKDADRDFLESVRTELFDSRVYALTPKGEVIELSQGATPLDFAYQVHTNLGHRCKGAKVNGRIVPLTYKLSNGEIVEIITGKTPAPSRHWLSPEEGYLASSRNRAKVRAWFRQLDEASSPAAQVAAVAAQPESQTPRRLPRAKTKTGKAKGKAGSPVEIEGVGDLPTTLARCCQPIRPQAIAGYVTLGRGVTIHRRECPGFLRMSEANPERVLEVRWTSGAEDLIPVQIFVTAHDRRGLIRDLGDLVALERLSIQSMSTATDAQSGIASFSIHLGVHTLGQLGRLLKRISALGNVIQARRTD